MALMYSSISISLFFCRYCYWHDGTKPPLLNQHLLPSSSTKSCSCYFLPSGSSHYHLSYAHSQSRRWSPSRPIASTLQSTRNSYYWGHSIFWPLKSLNPIPCRTQVLPTSWTVLPCWGMSILHPLSSTICQKLVFTFHHQEVVLPGRVSRELGRTRGQPKVLGGWFLVTLGQPLVCPSHP
jgi:hypothetical protein